MSDHLHDSLSQPGSCVAATARPEAPATHRERARGRWAAIRRFAGDTQLVAAVASSALAVALLSARFAYTGRPTFAFMVWNLFLAWLPWLLSLPVLLTRSRPGSGRLLLPVFLAWLLFLPNAPYMVTDLLHLRERSPVPLWYDALLFFSFAWAGCVLGFASLSIVHRRIDDWLGRAAGWAAVCGIGLLTGFGIYLGRFLRWNSWDVITRPHDLARDIAIRLLRPSEHPWTWAATFAFAAFMWTAYSVFRTPAPLREEARCGADGEGCPLQRTRQGWTR